MQPMMCLRNLACSLMCATMGWFALPAHALQSDFEEQISVTSNKQIAEIAKNEITFLEKVVITQGTILINADKVFIKQQPDGQLKQILATGHPATFQQKMENGRMIHAKGEELSYYPLQQTITIEKNAVIQQEDSRLSGDSITYNIKKERMEAKSTSQNAQNRVTTVFIPEQLKTQINDSKPNNKKQPQK